MKQAWMLATMFEKISLKSKPFTDGEFFKECMESAAEVLCPSQK